jgi:hypothetical protein
MTQTQVLEQIAELLDREHDAIEAVDVEGLAAIAVARQALIAQVMPFSARDGDALRTIETRRARNERAAEAAVDRIGSDLGRLGRGRTALAGYRPPAGGIPLSRALDQEV